MACEMMAAHEAYLALGDDCPWCGADRKSDAATPANYEARKDALVQAVKAHALSHYDEGGWDIVVEAYDDDQILDVVERCRTARGAIAKMAAVVGTVADYRAQIVSEGDLFPDDEMFNEGAREVERQRAMLRGAAG